MEKEKMKGFLNRATLIMNRSDQIAPKIPSKGQPTLAESGYLEGVDYQNQYTQQYVPQYTPQPQGGFGPGAKNLPKGILESIQQNPIQEYQGGGMNGLSVLDSIIPQQQSRSYQSLNEGYEYGEKRVPTTEEMFRSRTKNNNYQPNYDHQPQIQQPQQQQMSSIIDYSLISSIIKTAIAEEMTKLRKTIISENKQNNGASGDVIIKVGNGIQFITNNGNIYEGKLVKTGNVLNS